MENLTVRTAADITRLYNDVIDPMREWLQYKITDPTTPSFMHVADMMNTIRSYKDTADVPNISGISMRKSSVYC